MEFGLIGKSISYSYSKQIHSFLSTSSYEICSLNEDEFKSFILEKNFKGINVTIPYKSEIIKHLDHLSHEANKTGVVNTVINKNGKLYGYNTDVFGFEYLLDSNNISVEGKIVLILGSGATAKTIKYVLLKRFAKEVYFVSRKEKKGSITYREAEKKFLSQIIINTTPVGTYPQNENVLLDINKFPYLEACIDVTYNPLKTQFLLDAKSKGIKYINGLSMLIRQAIKAGELFYENKISLEEERSIARQILLKNCNILLIGMPASGKSTASKNLSKTLKLPRIDLDEEIEKEYNASVKEIIESKGIDYFRQLENQKVQQIKDIRGYIISIGGGTLDDDKNHAALIRNSIVFFLNKDIELIKKNKRAKITRPLLKDENSIDVLYEKRYPIFKKLSDIEIQNDKTQWHTLNLILEKLI